MATDGFPKCSMTLGLNADKKSGSLITMMGREVSISPDAVERCTKGRPVDGSRSMRLQDQSSLDCVQDYDLEALCTL